MAKLSVDVRSHLRFFAFVFANGTVDDDVLDIDTSDSSRILLEPSLLESIFAIFTNVLEIDECGNVLNADAAQRRAAQYIRRSLDPTFVVEPPWEPWEIELH